MRRLLIQLLLPFLFCLLPLLAAAVVAVAIPSAAMKFYLEHVSTMDSLILGLGAALARHRL